MDESLEEHWQSREVDPFAGWAHNGIFFYNIKSQKQTLLYEIKPQPSLPSVRWTSMPQMVPQLVRRG